MTCLEKRSAVLSNSYGKIGLFRLGFADDSWRGDFAWRGRFGLGLMGRKLVKLAKMSKEFQKKVDVVLKKRNTLIDGGQWRAWLSLGSRTRVSFFRAPTEKLDGFRAVFRILEQSYWLSRSQQRIDVVPERFP